MSEEIGGELVPDSTRDLDIDGELDLMIEDLDLWYGSNQALYGVSLPIAKNSVTALIGPSGCGKTGRAKEAKKLPFFDHHANVFSCIKIAEINRYIMQFYISTHQQTSGQKIQKKRPK